MAKLAKQHFSSPASRAKYLRLKKLYEPTERDSAEDGDAGGDSGDGDGVPAKPAPARGRSAEGHAPGKTQSLNNRASTDANAPSRRYVGKGAAAAVFARVLAAGKNDD